MAEPQNPPMLFYVDPQPLTVAQHGTWRLKDGDLAFTKDAVGVPLVSSEFVDAARYYPILFAASDEGGPIALTGIDNGNLFLKDNVWDPQTYIPAYVRRHPFILMALSIDSQNLALGIDISSNRVVQSGTEGAALFDGEKPSELTTSALNFCSVYASEANNTAEFTRALRAKGLLVERRLDFTLPGDKKFAINGFQTIESEKLSELDAETVVEWHRKGWMAACYAHLQSLARVNELLDRRSKQSA